LGRIDFTKISRLNAGQAWRQLLEKLWNEQQAKSGSDVPRSEQSANRAANYGRQQDGILNLIDDVVRQPEQHEAGSILRRLSQ
jgi:hypothetical protein